MKYESDLASFNSGNDVFSWVPQEMGIRKKIEELTLEGKQYSVEKLNKL